MLLPSATSPTWPSCAAPPLFSLSRYASSTGPPLLGPCGHPLQSFSEFSLCRLPPLEATSYIAQLHSRLLLSLTSTPLPGPPLFPRTLPAFAYHPSYLAGEEVFVERLQCRNEHHAALAVIGQPACTAHAHRHLDSTHMRAHVRSTQQGHTAGSHSRVTHHNVGKT